MDYVYVKMYRDRHKTIKKEKLGTSVQSIPIEYKSTEDLEKTLTIINDSLMSAYEKSYPLKKEGLGKDTQWCNEANFRGP